GGGVVPPDLLGRLLRHLVDRRRSLVAPPGFADLTPREKEVFRLAARGARKEEIGETLFISPATARTHLQRVYEKLGIHSQSELIALASPTTDPIAEEMN
ncbi:MAG TPA: helix-turn-helix transcriptional regulator, partial [Acidimicrobiia bacterium]